MCLWQAALVITGAEKFTSRKKTLDVIMNIILLDIHLKVLDMPPVSCFQTLHGAYEDSKQQYSIPPQEIMYTSENFVIRMDGMDSQVARNPEIRWLSKTQSEEGIEEAEILARQRLKIRN